METKKSELKKKVKEWLEFQEGYNIECLLENQDFAACLIECMVEFILKQTTSQQQTIERLREKASTLLSRLERRKPKNGYIFSVSIAIQDLQTVIEEAEQLLNTTEPNKTV